MPQFVHYTSLSAHTMSADVAAPALDMRDYVYYCMEFTWTGSPVGTVSVQGSIDQATWFDVITPVSCGGASGSLLANTVSGSAVPYIRGFYDYTSGTGALTVTTFLKTGA